jgi:hypothetical protein
VIKCCAYGPWLMCMASIAIAGRMPKYRLQYLFHFSHRRLITIGGDL